MFSYKEMANIITINHFFLNNDGLVSCNKKINKNSGQ